MSKFKKGDRVWWLSGVNMENCVGMGVQLVNIMDVATPEAYTIRNDVAEFKDVEPGSLYTNKKEALAAAMKKLAEEPTPPPKPKTDTINHPPHYNSGKAKCVCGRRIECIDVTREMNFPLGNAIKYIWRSEHKNGAEDIKKAIWYLNDYLKNKDAGQKGNAEK